MMFVLDNTLYFIGLLFGIIASIMSSQVYHYQSLVFCRNQKVFFIEGNVYIYKSCGCHIDNNGLITIVSLMSALFYLFQSFK
jgi:hypothetical protein